MMKRIASLLFIPAIGRMMRKAFDCAADAVIFDLEDSIKPEEKEAALDRLKSFLSKAGANRRALVYVRLNADSMSRELEMLKSVDRFFDGIVIPKAEEAAAIRDMDYSGEKLALIETPKGMINLPDIAAEPSVSMILFGAEDYTSITGMANNEDLLLPLKLEIVKHARANGKRCVDTICKEYRNEEIIKDSVRRSKDMGFDGKLLIHPLQVAITNDVFTASDIEKKRRILAAFEKCPNGVLKYEGQIYESPHIEMIRREIGQYDQK